MAFALSGYVLEKPRVGTVNSPYTLSPDNGVLSAADQTAYNAVFNSSETNPRVEYMTIAYVDGNLADAEFGWTKNENIQRFDWDGKAQRFATMPGAAPTLVTAALDPAQANVQRLKIAVPLFPLVGYPYRLYIGLIGSGTAFTIDLVDDETGFGTPPPVGHVQLSKATGTLNWNATDLATYAEQPVYFQRQTFFQKKDVTGTIGTIPATGIVSFLLNPIPGAGQYPLIRFGYGLYLQAIAVPNETSFSTPDPGSFQWAENTGLLRFNAADLAAHPGATVYYDGVLMAAGLQLPRQALGTPASPGTISPMPPSGGELILRTTTIVSTGSATFPNSGTLQDTSANFSSPAVAVGDVIVITSGPSTGTRRKVTKVISNTQLGVQPSFPNLAAASYNIERLVYQWGQTDRYTSLSSASTPAAKAGIAQVDDTGAVRFATTDQAAYGAYPLEVISGDLLLERGISMRFFRTPVNTQATDPTLKDISIYYPTTGATIANPVVGFPMALLPILPIDDPAYPMAYHITQGTGSFVGDLIRLDTPSPPDGTGYTLDFDSGMIKYAVRKSGVLVPIITPAGHVQLPDPIVDPNNIVLELDQGSGFNPLILDQNAILEPTSGTVVFVSTQGTTEEIGLASTFSGNLLTDTTKNFITDGVMTGDLLVVPSGAAEGLYDITAVTSTTLTTKESAPSAVTNLEYEVRRGKEVMADRFFQTVSLADPNTIVEKIRSLGTISNSPRLNVLPSLVSATRFRFGQSTFVTPTVVANDGAFTAPSSLPAGQVQISSATGNLNFSSVDVASAVTIFWVNKLIEGVDYRIGAQRGLIQLTQRLLANDELLVSYQPLEDINNPPPTPTPYQVERATFQVRKELAVHPTQGSTATFNPLGRTIATNPPVSVWRGGRPQDSTQVSIDTVNSTLTFLPDAQITDAIPHGSVLLPTENVYVDYYIYNAIGGENTTQVLIPPITYATVNLLETATSFGVPGDHVADFPADSILRVGKTELYYLAAPTYDPVAKFTTVNLAAPQTIQNDWQQPVLEVTSGPTRAFSTPSYFVVDSSFVAPIPRGMNNVTFVGDVSKTYLKGTVLYFTDGTVNDFLFCEGSSFSSDSGLTTLTFSSPTVRQYNPGTHTLRRSVRPILESVATATTTSKAPVLTEGFVIFRQVEGQPGQVLMNVAKGGTPPASTSVKIDDSGNVVFTNPLQPSEEFSILYTGYQTIASGTVRAAYTATIVPNDTNGLNNQIFTADFTAYSPDTFYFRVETMTNFQGEIAQQYKDTAKASVPSGGPNTSNASGTPLYKQGQASVFFNEGHLGNEDIIARATLKFYNDIINDLEDVLQNFDGRVVGDSDGRFLFDGTTGSVRSGWSSVQNQIDDTFEISPFPVTFNGTTFTFTGTYQKVYLPSATSRFYKTSRKAYGITTAGHNSSTKPNTGDPVLDLGAKNLNNVGTIFKRTPRALITQDVPAGATVIPVDNSGQATLAPDGVTPLLRPAFQNNERAIIPGYLNDPSTTTVTGTTPTSVSLSSGVPVAVPKGATLTLSTTDSTAQSPAGYQQSYRGNYDVGIDAEKGLLTYIDPYFPFDGSLPLIPEPLIIHPVDEKEMLQTNISYYNVATAPNKIPVLYGQTLTDDGDQAVPFINPSQTSEGVLLADELALDAPSGPILTSTTAPFVGTATLDGTQTVLTLTSPLTFPTPLPQVYDLVRILSGANANSNFYRIAGFTANTITVETAFPSAETGPVSILVTTATNIITGTVTTPTTTTVTDAAIVDFAALGVVVGHTIVFTSGTNAGARRQITGIALNVLTLDQPISLGVDGYRIYNPLSTFSGMASLLSILSGEQAALTGPSSTPNSERVALNNFFNTVFQDITPSGGVAGTTTTPATLTTSAVDFEALGVGSQDYVYIETGSAEGVYPIASVMSSTTLMVDPTVPFPASGSVTFRIVSAFGVTKVTLLAVAPVKTAIDQFVTSIPPFQALLTTLVPVSTTALPAGDPTMYAIAVQPSDFASRHTAVQARITALTAPTGYISTIAGVLTSGDRLYDKRYTWIDARINLQKGILTQISQSVSQRIQAQQDTVNALIKLLAVQGT